MDEYDRIKCIVGSMIFDAIEAERADQKRAATLISGAAFQLAHAALGLNQTATKTWPPGQHMTLDEVREAIREELGVGEKEAIEASLKALDCIEKKQYAVAGGYLLRPWPKEKTSLATACQRALSEMDKGYFAVEPR